MKAKDYQAGVIVMLSVIGLLILSMGTFIILAILIIEPITKILLAILFGVFFIQKFKHLPKYLKMLSK